MNSYNRIYTLLIEDDEFPTQHQILQLQKGMSPEQIGAMNRAMTKTRKPGSKRGSWRSSKRAKRIALRSRP
jgi:hypothetical protein